MFDGAARASGSEETPKKSLLSKLRTGYAKLEPWIGCGHLGNVRRIDRDPRRLHRRRH